MRFVLRSIVLCGALHFSTFAAMASTITLDVTPTMVSLPPVAGFVEHDFFFDDLNGVMFSGQTVSVDFFFTEGVFLRRLNSEDMSGFFIASLSLETNGSGNTGFFGPGSTGFLVGTDGLPLDTTLGVGRATRITPPSGPGVGLIADELNDFDISGVHYDLVMPTTGYLVTRGRIRFGTHEGNSFDFRTAAVPDRPMTIVLFSMALLCLVASASLAAGNRAGEH